MKSSPFITTLCAGFLILAAPSPRLAADPLARLPLSSSHFDKLHEGDLIFILSSSPRAKLIVNLTHSDLTHCGVVFKENGQWVVYDGAGRNTTHPTPLNDWIVGESTDENGHVDHPLHELFVRRLKDTSILTDDNLTKLKTQAQTLQDTNYDFGSAWNNKDTQGREYIYCSELLYKAYHNALTIDVGAPHALKGYYTDAQGNIDTAKKAAMDTALNSSKSKSCRKGQTYDPAELAISPEEVYESDNLVDVNDNSP